MTALESSDWLSRAVTASRVTPLQSNHSKVIDWGRHYGLLVGSMFLSFFQVGSPREMGLEVICLFLDRHADCH